MTARAVVSATGNRLKSLWKGSVSMLWIFINHYICRRGIILIDYAGGRRGDWLWWRRVANYKPTCGSDCFHLSYPTDYSHKSASKNIYVYICVKSIQSFGATMLQFHVKSEHRNVLFMVSHTHLSLCMSFGPGSHNILSVMQAFRSFSTSEVGGQVNTISFRSTLLGF